MADVQKSYPSGAELEIKRRGRRRLIGAITLGLLAIVFLPMLFDSEPKSEYAARKSVVMVVPAKEGQPPLPPPTLPPVTEANQAVDTAHSQPAIKPSIESTTPSKPAPVPLQSTEAAPPTPITAAQLEKSLPLKFVVQLGAFSDAENIKQIVDKMKEVKLPVYTEKIAVSKGTVTRIRVGPYTSREKADQILEQIKKTGIQGKIVPL